MEQEPSTISSTPSLPPKPPQEHDKTKSVRKHPRRSLLLKMLLFVILIIAIISGFIVLVLSVLTIFLFQSEPSDNPLNNQKAAYKKVLEQAANEASVGWMRQKDISADGCTLSWKNTESCDFSAFLKYRNEKDARTAARSMEGRGWRSNTNEEERERGYPYDLRLGDYIKTIDGKNVCVTISVDRDDGTAYASVNALECADYAKLKTEAYADWSPYLPMQVPVRFTFAYQETPLYKGEITLDYRTDARLSNSMRIGVEQYRFSSKDFDPPRHCPITYLDNGESPCYLRVKTPKGIEIYTSNKYDDQYHYLKINNTFMIIREWETSDALSEAELVQFVDSMSAIEPEKLRTALPPIE